MSWNSPGWIPGAPHQDDVPVCGRCGIEGLVSGYLRSPQDEATRQALLAELEKLDDQTARADAYSDLRAVAVRYQVPRS